MSLDTDRLALSGNDTLYEFSIYPFSTDSVFQVQAFSSYPPTQAYVPVDRKGFTASSLLVMDDHKRN